VGGRGAGGGGQGAGWGGQGAGEGGKGAGAGNKDPLSSPSTNKTDVHVATDLLIYCLHSN
jgi:hypothetical protein